MLCPKKMVKKFISLIKKDKHTNMTLWKNLKLMSIIIIYIILFYFIIRTAEDNP